MGSPRILVVASNHPARRSGGSEAVAYAQFRAFNRIGAQASLVFPDDHPGMGDHGAIVPFGSRPNEFAFRMGSGGAYRLWDDRRRMSRALVRSLRCFLLTNRFDVVHFHHVFRIGLDVIECVRQILPRALLVLTVHDYKLLCPSNGQLLRRHERRAGLRVPCTHRSLERCLECCSSLGVADLLQRDARVGRCLEALDLVVSPSEFCRRTFIERGMDPARIVYCPNGLTHAMPSGPVTRCPRGGRSFGYFGRSVPEKGLGVLLAALKRVLQEGPPVALELDVNCSGVVPAGFHGAACHDSAAVRVHGPYRGGEVASRMRSVAWVVVPSVWWENAPLVIDEAQSLGRPVICSDAGGMAEKVVHLHNGLLFRMGDPASLAEAMMTAAGNEPLWTELSSHAERPPTAVDAAARLLRLYRRGWV